MAQLKNLLVSGTSRTIGKGYFGGLVSSGPSELIHNSNEFNFIPVGYSGDIYINYKDSARTNGNIGRYRFCKGQGDAGTAEVVAATFTGNLSGNVSTTNGNVSGTTYLLFSSGLGGTQTIRNAASLYHYDTGSAGYLNIGSSTRTGALTLHYSNGGYVNLQTDALTANTMRTITLPNQDGKLIVDSMGISPGTGLYSLQLGNQVYHVDDGNATVASGNYALAMGSGTKATGWASFAGGAGYNTVASGSSSFAFGTSYNFLKTEASGIGAVTFGGNSTANWAFSVSGTASHAHAFAMGQGTVTGAANQFVVGKYNASSSTALFVVGGGTSSAGQNIFYVSPTGTYAEGLLVAGTACYNGDYATLDTRNVSGTANYIPKFTAANKIGNSGITDDGTTIKLGRSTVVQATTTNYSEGLRILPHSTGWGLIFFSANSTTTGTHDGGWLVGRMGVAGGAGQIGDFTIENNNSTAKGLTVHKADASISVYGPKVNFGDQKATMKYNSTDECIEFVFN
jgi:hypothetical protein